MCVCVSWGSLDTHIMPKTYSDSARLYNSTVFREAKFEMIISPQHLRNNNVLWIEIPSETALDTFTKKKKNYSNSPVRHKCACSSTDHHQSRQASLNTLWASVLTNALAEVFAKILFPQFPSVFGQWTLAPHLW